MKKFITVIIICAVAFSAHATTKCISWPSGSSQPGGNNGAADWYFTYTNGFTVKGVAFCSNQSGNTELDISDTLTKDNENIENNRFCWCKMISPAISKWVYFKTYATYTACNSCVWECGSYAQWYAGSKYRSALFNNIQE